MRIAEMVCLGEGMVKQIYGWLSFVFLGLGISIYLFFRGMDIFLFKWIPKPSVLALLYKPLRPSAFTLVLLYHLPDMLWFLSGIFLLRYLWFNNKKWEDIYIGSFYGIAAILEIIQFSRSIPGTFDPMDLFYMGICAVFEVLLYKFFIKRRK
jgi:hypothetical protein